MFAHVEITGTALVRQFAYCRMFRFELSLSVLYDVCGIYKLYLGNLTTLPKLWVLKYALKIQTPS